MKTTKKLAAGLIVVAIFLIVGLVFKNDIHDWFKLRGYTPSSDIVALANDTTMLPNSRKLFFVNHPVVADKETFNSYCRENEHSIVLGCYLPGQQGIYLLDVSDERLDGIKEVTAAHELLHAAYERLNSNERRWVDSLLQTAFENTKETRIHETIELYRQQDPQIVPNEMHSIFGTEVRNLSPELEEYYGRYFSNRHQIVGLAEQYEQAFTERRNKIRQLDAELAALKTDIDNSSQILNQKEVSLKNLRSQMNAYRSQGQTNSYNELVPAYNSQVNEFNSLIDEVSASIVRYNAIVQERNEISSEEAELVEAIDSREILPSER